MVKDINILKIFDYLVLFASIVLMVAISVEILDGKAQNLEPWFIRLQLVVCILYIFDFFISLAAADDIMKYISSHFMILLISLPYISLPIDNWFDINHEGVILIALMPVLRSFVAIYVLLRWLIRRRSALRILCAYILTVISFTYISALLFYECELQINDGITGFGDALWWAAMGLTTTELTIIPVTTTGKVLAVALPMAGMMMLPIATNYIVSISRLHIMKNDK